MNLEWDEGIHKRGARRPRRAKQLSKEKVEYLKSQVSTRPFWKGPDIVPTSPLARTSHPTSQWADEEEELKDKIANASAQDAPICEIVNLNSAQSSDFCFTFINELKTGLLSHPG